MLDEAVRCTFVDIPLFPIVVWSDHQHEHQLLQKCSSPCDWFVPRASSRSNLHFVFCGWIGNELHQSDVFFHQNSEFRLRRRWLCESVVMSSSSVHALSIRRFRESRLSWYTPIIKSWSVGYTDTPILDTNTGKNASYILKVEDVAATIIDGLKHDYSVIECNMV